MTVDLKLAHFRTPLLEFESSITPKLVVTPGDVITNDTGFMRGHGTFTENDVLFASVGGTVERVNKLVYVKSLHSRYVGEVGDVVVGRITEVQEKRWKVDINSRLEAILMLSSVNLPGGELRRRSVEDELAMRQYLQEGDLISAEVQLIHSDGTLSLHTRSLKFGKLSQGILLKVPPSLIKRCKIHTHILPMGPTVIFGNNGYIWLTPEVHNQTGDKGGYQQNLQMINKSEREIISRLRNCIMALAKNKVILCDTSLNYCYEASLDHEVKSLLMPEIMLEVASLTRHRLEIL